MKTIVLLKDLRTKCNEVNRDCDKCDEVIADLCNELCGIYNPHSVLGTLNRIKKYEEKHKIERLKDLEKYCDTRNTCAGCKRKAECQEMCGNNTPWIVFENMRRGLR